MPILYYDNFLPDAFVPILMDGRSFWISLTWLIKTWHDYCAITKVTLFALVPQEIFAMKKWIESFLKKIETANKKNFGSDRMDCCDLNSKNQPAPEQSSEKNNRLLHSLLFSSGTDPSGVI
ncbi:MAG: LDCC motif putative metal-binding protein [Bacillota bacterium]|nr:LDCC motif putative metal-binding protein [Bacillota bacterium]